MPISSSAGDRVMSARHHPETSALTSLEFTFTGLCISLPLYILWELPIVLSHICIRQVAVRLYPHRIIFYQQDQKCVQARLISKA
ncbi:hypothetical protein BDV25DRAFT_163792 [Aspergillus avenaceus]|uniref:Uncharacterized protein n=1 Tax=Aspergillus avenaceus TaxID=36643 RepID=A0A5N6THE9_ASPAV|nr:hypothetical protein BDV25DRAFT_163792 [Aspergillus avenaceus]